MTQNDVNRKMNNELSKFRGMVLVGKGTELIKMAASMTPADCQRKKRGIKILPKCNSFIDSNFYTSFIWTDCLPYDKCLLNYPLGMEYNRQAQSLLLKGGQLTWLRKLIKRSQIKNKTLGPSQWFAKKSRGSLEFRETGCGDLWVGGQVSKG